jgi:hypothetical protein
VEELEAEPDPITGQMPLVNCGDTQVLVVPPGDTFTCVVDDGIEVRDVVIRVDDVNGLVTVIADGRTVNTEPEPIGRPDTVVVIPSPDATTPTTVPPDSLARTVPTAPTEPTVPTTIELGEVDPDEEEVFYATCADAEADAMTPLFEGDPGYRPELDPDGDGIACDDFGSDEDLEG